MGIRISKDHLHPSVIESITSLIGDLSQLETTAKGNAVEAINELLANGGNKEELEALIAEIAEGKELIANAVGEPLDSNDTFSAMSNDINSLLSTFKTNMMNNGVTVESSDRFKSLIDKIATLADNEGSGIQFASGYTEDCLTTGRYDYEFETIYSTHTINFTEPIDFTPTYLFVIIPKVYNNDVDDGYVSYNVIISNITRSAFSNSYGVVSINSVSNTGFVIGGDTDVSIGGSSGTNGSRFIWYAIGVGEEDTTLRDSLASILTEEGVDITEEDDMASLISKVDEEFENKNNTQFYESELIADNGKKYPSLTSTGNARTFTISPGFTPKTIIMKAYTLSSTAFMYVISHFHTNSSNCASKSLQYAQNSSSYTDFYIWIDSFSSESVNCHIAVGDLDGGSSLSTTVYIKIYAIA